MTVPSTPPPAWTIIDLAIRSRRAVRIRYHGHDRVISPHALGWKNGRAKVLVFQSAGATSQGDLPVDPHQRWRSLFIDQIEQATISTQPWQTADNYNRNDNGIDQLETAIPT